MKYRLGLYEKSMPNTLSLREKLIMAKKSGFDYLDLSIDETEEKLARLDWSDEEIVEIHRTMGEVGVPIVSICLSAHRKYSLGNPNPEYEARGLVIMKKAIDLAARLSVRQIQIAGYDVYYEESTPETRTRFAVNLAKCVEMASEMGVLLSFETMELPFFCTVTKAMRFVNMMKSPYLQVYPDIGNVTNGVLQDGGTVEEDLEAGRGHISAMHLKETLPGIYRELRYGTGHVDFGAAIKKALELGVRMFVAEFWYTGNDDWEQHLLDSAAYIRRLFPKED